MIVLWMLNLGLAAITNLINEHVCRLYHVVGPEYDFLCYGVGVILIYSCECLRFGLLCIIITFVKPVNLVSMNNGHI